MLTRRTLIATAAAVGLTGLGAVALLAPGSSSTGSRASAEGSAPVVRTQVVTHVIRRVRHVTDRPRRLPPQPVAVPVAVPTPVSAPPAEPVRTHASGAGEEHEDEHADREDEALDDAEEADD